VLELSLGDVEARDVCAQRMECDRPLRGTTAKLEHVLAVNVAKD
jgi:hypothetical protein